MKTRSADGVPCITKDGPGIRGLVQHDTPCS
jgi:hypothetical protein